MHDAQLSASLAVLLVDPTLDPVCRQAQAVQGLPRAYPPMYPTAIHSSPSGGEPLRLPLTYRNLNEMALQ